MEVDGGGELGDGGLGGGGRLCEDREKSNKQRVRENTGELCEMLASVGTIASGQQRAPEERA